MAIVARDRFGVGQTVDVALYEGVFRMLDELAPVYAKTGEVRERMGADTVNAVPHSHYQTKDGRWVALACSSDKMWQRLTQVMGRPALADRENFANVAQRVEKREEVNCIVANWIGALPLAEIMERCIAGDVPIGPLNSIADIFADEQFKARGNLIEREDPREGKIVIPNVVPRLSETPGEVRSLGPDLGAHNQAVYRDLLGLSEEEISSLGRAGVI
jgi:crotonobetainyl-CoA:carnitine CoA-transferase CaiB-like acyl-CoA transferase